jgi:formylglycine-generating enzyme required for sulfatase activity
LFAPYCIALISALAFERAVCADVPPATITNNLGMHFVKVPGTKVLFCVWITRVQDYEQYMKAALKTAESPEYKQGPTHPAVNVSWHDAKAFCQWLTDKERQAGLISKEQSYRLPTDAEWSVAVGLSEPTEGTPEAKDGKIKDVFPWGTEWPPPRDVGNYAERLHVDSFTNTSPVGSFKANALGLYDMGGNVAQWCEDWYNARQRERTLRGAGWASDNSSGLLSSRRGFMQPQYRLMAAGFRCVLTEKLNN